MIKKSRSFSLSDEDFAFINSYSKEGQTEALENILKRLRTLEQNQPSQQIQSDVPLGMPPNPEKDKAIQELKQEALTPLPPPPCNFVGKGYIDPKTNVQMIYCDNPQREKHPVSLPLTICQACWKRKEWAKNKREQEAEERASEPEPEPEHVLKRKDKTIMEKIDDGTLEYKCERDRETYQLKNLPCLTDHSLQCGFKECEQRINHIFASFQANRFEGEA